MSAVIELTGTVKHETADAYLFSDGDVEVWLPKSLCEWDLAAKEMTLPEWLAIDRGLV